MRNVIKTDSSAGFAWQPRGYCADGGNGEIIRRILHHCDRALFVDARHAIDRRGAGRPPPTAVRATCRRRVPAISSASPRRMQPSIASSSSAAAAEMMMAMNNGAFSGSKPLRMGRRRSENRLSVRPLGCCERFFHLYSLAFPVHFCLVAQIEGALDSAKLAAALEQVRRRHSALRVCIVDDAETGPAFHRIDNPIELHAAPAETAADWRRVVERELNLPFEYCSGPADASNGLVGIRWHVDRPDVSSCDHGCIVRNAHPP